MAGLGDRFSGWIDERAIAWKDLLRGWMAGVLGFGIEVFMDVLAESYSKKLTPMLDSIGKMSGLPSEIEPLLHEIKTPTGEAAALMGARMGSGMVGGVIDRVMNVFLAGFAADLNRKSPRTIMAPDAYITAYLRGVISEAELEDALRVHGFNEYHQKIWRDLAKVLFPSDIVGPAWLRDKPKYAKFWEEVKQLGVDDEHIELLKEMTFRIPGVQDVIRYAVKEAYSPDIYKAFGQDAEFPTEALPDAERAGVRADYLMKEWIAHWDLPGVTQGYSMLHRGLITREQLQLLLKARDIMPFWRDKLIGLSYGLPNRIELRMMARYGLIDKPKLLEILLKGGADPQYVELIADMNIAVGLITDLRTRYANGYISAGDIQTELASAGLAPDIQLRLYQYIVKVEKPARTAAEKTATSAEIMSAVKKGVISYEDGVARLVAQNYSEAEAIFKLEVYLTVATGSIKSVGEAKFLTDLQQAAQGLPTDRPTQEIIESAKAVAATHPQPVRLSEEEVRTRVDTIRRKRRRRELTRDEEVTELLGIGVDISLATAYAENDSLRLQKGVGD